MSQKREKSKKSMRSMAGQTRLKRRSIAFQRESKVGKTRSNMGWIQVHVPRVWQLSGSDLGSVATGLDDLDRNARTLRVFEMAKRHHFMPYIKPNFSFLFIIKPNIISERCIIFRSKRCVRSLSLSPIQYFCFGEANTEQSHEEVVPMASIMSQPGCCIRIHRRCCFNTLRFFSSKPFASHSNSHRHFSRRPIRKTFAFDVSRSFSHSHHLVNTDAPTLHHFTAQASLTASQPPPE